MKYVNVNCPSCLSKGLEIFYEAKQVPVHSVLLMSSRDMAVNYRKGDISLGFCPACGFVSNTSFDPSVHDYSCKYEETQGFSQTFNVFHHDLAQTLIEKHALKRKTVIEIGCGKGDFLNMICELGDNEGVGFDPAYLPERDSGHGNANVRFIKDFYSEKYSNYKADFLCCKMTLEHIHNTAQFLKAIRNSIGDNHDTTVFFQVPNLDYILEDTAFWDVYYEHCSYFTLDSLADLFSFCGFEVLDGAAQYESQYLMMTARPRSTNAETGSDSMQHNKERLQIQKQKIQEFQQASRQKISEWQQRILRMNKLGEKIVLWGGGSKGVAFLTTLNLTHEIEYAVDINPFKHGTFMGGTGQEIISPNFLQNYKPDRVIVMNPVYKDEIGNQLREMGVSAELLAV